MAAALISVLLALAQAQSLTFAAHELGDSPADYGEFGPVRDLTFGQVDVSIRALEFEVKNGRGLVTFESLSCLVRAKENGRR